MLSHKRILFIIVSALLVSSCGNNIEKSALSSFYRIVAPATLAIARNIYPEAHFDIPTGERWVALTIDDAPTERILELLASSAGNPHATFFVIGEYGAENPDLLEAISAGNHELGNHSYVNSPTIELSLTEFVTSVENTHSVLRPYLDSNDPKWFRPGFAKYTPQHAGYLIEQRGYEIALGNVYPYDYGDNNISAAVRYIKLFVRPGSIIVLHDGGEMGLRTVEILEQVLPWLWSEGYSVKSLSELLAGRSS